MDKTLTQMQFVGADDTPLGAINWFAVQPASMGSTNKLVSSDNVGYASVLFEQALSNNTLVGKVRHFILTITSSGNFLKCPSKCAYYTMYVYNCHCAYKNIYYIIRNILHVMHEVANVTRHQFPEDLKQLVFN